MAIGDIGLVSALRTRMQWHQARQRVLAENVANADTPHYKAKDLAKPELPAAVASAVSGTVGGSLGGVRTASVTLAATQTGHLTGNGGAGFKTTGGQPFEVRPSGNAVDLEDQMAKSAENQLDYQTVASLYQQSLALLRTAVGRK